MERHNLYSSSLLLAMASLICYKAYRIGLGRPDNPGEGFAPFWISFVLALLSAYLLFGSYLKVMKGRGGPIGVATWRKPVYLLFLLFLYAFLLRFLGFLAVTFLLMLFLLYSFGGESLRKSLLFSVLISFIFYFLFARGLQLPLPTGLIWDYLKPG